MEARTNIMHGKTRELAAPSAGPSNTRNFGLDILRMVAMLFVVVLHEISHGGLLEATSGFHHVAILFMRSFTFCAVDCFVLITGYCQIGLSFKSRRIISLWSIAVFYSVAIVMFFLAYDPSAVSPLVLGKMFTPVITNRWWFFTAYFFLMLVAPFINACVAALDRKQASTLFGVCIVALCIVPFLAGANLVGFGSGYSFGWFVVLYVVGGCLKKLDVFRTARGFVWFAFYILFALALWGLDCATFGIEGFSPGIFPDSSWSFTTYVSPLVLGAAIALVGVFSKLELTAAPLQRLARFVTPSVFAVYLISDHQMVRKTFMKDAFVDAASLHTREMLAIMIAAALAVFVVCILIDLLRRLLFKICHVDQAVNWAATLIDHRICSDVNHDEKQDTHVGGG